MSYLGALSGSPVTATYPYRDTRQTVGRLIEIHRWCFADARTAGRLIKKASATAKTSEDKPAEKQAPAATAKEKKG